MENTNSVSALMYNATLASSAVAAAFELGLLEKMKTAEKISLNTFCKEKGLDSASIYALVYALSCFDIFKLDQEKNELSQGLNFQEIYKDKGYFFWMFGGYGSFLNRFAEMAATKNRSGSFFSRDGAAIAASGKDYGGMYVDPYVDQIMDSISFNKVADLGCGSAERLIRLISKGKGRKGVGIEINPEGANFARQNVAARNCSECIEIVQGDAAKLTKLSSFEDVDILTSFFMGHDLWPRENCIKVFQNFLQAFPNLKYFLFCDTYRSEKSPAPYLPTFTLGFEVFHAFMGQYIPSLAEWRTLINDAGWECIKQVEIGIPFTCIFLLAPLNAKK